MSKTILVRAVNGSERSTGIKAYFTGDDVKKLPAQFLLRIDDGVNKQTGKPTLKITNSDLDVYASHNPEWLSNAVTGYRRKVGDVTCIIVERVQDDLPNLLTAELAEVF